MNVYTIQSKTATYYLTLHPIDDNVLYKINVAGEFFSGGYCRVGVDLFYWEKDTSLIPRTIKDGGVDFDVAIQ